MIDTFPLRVFQNYILHSIYAKDGIQLYDYFISIKLSKCDMKFDGRIT